MLNKIKKLYDFIKSKTRAKLFFYIKVNTNHDNTEINSSSKN